MNKIIKSSIIFMLISSTLMHAKTNKSKIKYIETKLTIKTISNGVVHRDIFSYKYNKFGDLLIEEVDLGGDGTIDSTEAYTYNLDRNITYNIRYKIHSENAIVEYIYTNAYNKKGMPISRTADNDSDGVIDWKETYEYNNTTHTKISNTDSNGDGVVDAILETIKDKNKTTIISKDTNANIISTMVIIPNKQDIYYDKDNNITYVSYYEYDKNKNLLMLKEDKDGDGKIDTIQTSTYTKDNNLLISLYHNIHNHKMDTKTVKKYNKQGKLSETIEYNYEGKENSIIKEIYRTKFLHTTIYDSNADGKPDMIMSTKIDSNGNIIAYYEDFDADGISDTIYLYEWKKLNNQLSSKQSKPIRSKQYINGVNKAAKSYLSSLTGKMIGKELKGFTYTYTTKLQRAIYLEDMSDKNNGHHIYKFKKEVDDFYHEYTYIWAEKGSKNIKIPDCNGRYAIAGGISYIDEEQYTGGIDIVPSDMIVIADCNLDIESKKLPLLKKIRSKLDKMVGEVKGEGDKKSFINLLRVTKDLIELPGNIFSWTKWGDKKEAIREINHLISSVKKGQNISKELELLYKKEDNLRELAAIGGWNSLFEKLKNEYEHFKKRKY